MLLSSRELVAPRAYKRFHSIGLLVHKGPRLAHFQGLAHIGNTRVGLAHLHIFLDARVEQDWLLGHVADLLSVMG